MGILLFMYMQNTSLVHIHALLSVIHVHVLLSVVVAHHSNLLLCMCGIAAALLPESVGEILAHQVAYMSDPLCHLPFGRTYVL
jgi:hypothetical protein